MEDGFLLFWLYCDASIDGFGATLEQAQNDEQRTMKPTVYANRATSDTERHLQLLDLEDSASVWPVSRPH